MDVHRASPVEGEATQDHTGWGLCLVEEAEAIGFLPHVLPLNSNRGWHGEWFYIRNPMKASFSPFTGRRLERRGPSSWRNKLEVIKEELQKLV